MKITKTAGGKLDEEAKAHILYEQLLSHTGDHEEAMAILNHLIQMVQNSPQLATRIRTDFRAASKKACPKCHSANTTFVEAHADCDAGQDEMVLKCRDCGFTGG